MDQLNSSISVDCVIFGFDTIQLKILLIERVKLPEENLLFPSCTLKLPGDLIKDTDDLDRSAYRILKELTGLDHVFLKQFAIFGKPNRLNNPNDLTWLCSTSKLKVRRVVTVTYYSLLKIVKSNPAKTLLNGAYWIPIKKVPQLAFDHNFIIESGLKALHKEMQTEPFGFELLPKKFTIRQVQNLYEEILGKKLDNRNFRKKLRNLKYIVALPEREKNVNHKPAQLYKLDKKKILKPRKILVW
jgi:ADP-ribose pyrophosphatase YjhB (NUDIX family)